MTDNDAASSSKADSWNGLIGVVAGNVKTRDQVLSSAAAVLVGLPVLWSEGVVIGILAITAIAVGYGLLIRLRKWKLGVPRHSSDY